MNDQPPAAEPAADAPGTDARRGPAIGGAFAGAAVLLILAAVLVGLRPSGTRPAAAPAATTSAAETAPATAAPAPPHATAPSSTGGGAAPATVATPAALSKRPTVRPGGARKLTRLTVTTLIRGGGRKVRTGQLLTVNYVLARYRTGEELDASWDTGQPLQFRVGSGAAIEGFDRGVVGVPVGSRVRLDVPARLAYGDPAPPGRPDGDLSFVVDVLAAR